MGVPLQPTDTTHVVELTPRGRGALAVVLVAGPAATHVAARCFTAYSGQPLDQCPVGRILLGRWRGSGEELIVCRRSDDRVEIHCHGGLAAVGAIVDALVEHGCRATPWQDWVRATEDNPLRAAARLALAEAPTARTSGVLLDQYHGALEAAVRSARDAVSGGRWQRADETLAALLASAELGQHLTMPWRVVLAGRPNVGKSSLKNALVGYRRTIVADVPGTTRDVVATTTAIDGWPIQLTDTAGLRDSRDDVEAAGVARAAAALVDADLVVAIVDATDGSESPASQTRNVLSQLPATTRRLHVVNKIDLLTQRPAPDGRIDVRTSAVTGEGIAELVQAIARSLVPRPPAPGAAVPFTAKQVAALNSAHAAVQQCDAPSALAALQSLLAE